MDRTTQTNLIVKYMRTHKSGITSMQAIEMYGATRLASIIHSLRRRGYDIATVMEEGKNRYGGRVSYARYVLKEEK